jgi:hypothetical protein
MKFNIRKLKISFSFIIILILTLIQVTKQNIAFKLIVYQSLSTTTNVPEQIQKFDYKFVTIAKDDITIFKSKDPSSPVK